MNNKYIQTATCSEKTIGCVIPNRLFSFQVSILDCSRSVMHASYFSVAKKQQVLCLFQLSVLVIVFILLRFGSWRLRCGLSQDKWMDRDRQIISITKMEKSFLSIKLNKTKSFFYHFASFFFLSSQYEEVTHNMSESVCMYFISTKA